MLQHQEALEVVRRQHQEAQQEAEAGTLGRLAVDLREQSQQHPNRTRFLAIVSPIAVALGILAILI